MADLPASLLPQMLVYIVCDVHVMACPRQLTSCDTLQESLCICPLNPWPVIVMVVPCQPTRWPSGWGNETDEQLQASGTTPSMCSLLAWRHVPNAPAPSGSGADYPGLGLTRLLRRRRPWALLHDIRPLLEVPRSRAIAEIPGRPICPPFNFNTP